jgi:hypothetical protein
LPGADFRASLEGISIERAADPLGSDHLITTCDRKGAQGMATNVGGAKRVVRDQEVPNSIVVEIKMKYVVGLDGSSGLCVNNSGFRRDSQRQHPDSRSAGRECVRGEPLMG